MQKFIKNIILFFIAFFLFDKIFFLIIALSPSLEFDNRLEEIIKGEMEKDLIILGSSRGARNVIASQIEDSLGYSSYNLSYPGSDVEFHEFILRTLIKFNKPPKKLLLVVDESRELLPSEELVFRLDRLYPLAKYAYINDEMIARGEKSISSRILILSRMNLRNFDLRRKKFSAIDSISKCGSMPISYQKHDLVFKYDSTTRIYQAKTELDYKIISFLNIQEMCIKENIDFYVVFSPNFRAPNRSFEDRIRKLTIKDVPFIRYDSLNQIYEDPTYYYDYIHLQECGAVVFTNDIIDYLESEEKDQADISKKQ